MEPNCQIEEDDDMDFDWKDGFIDNPVDMLGLGDGGNDWGSFASFGDNFHNLTSTPLNVNLFSKGPTSSNQGSSPNKPKVPRQRNRQKPLPPDVSTASGDLAPTRIRRQYNCDACNFRTINPREFLYHRRDEHNAKVKIVECPYCVYACQYFQKLQRHILLVHKLETITTPPSGLAGDDENGSSLDGSSKGLPPPLKTITSGSLTKKLPPLKILPKPDQNSTMDDSQDDSLMGNDFDDSREPSDQEQTEDPSEVEATPQPPIYKCETCGYCTKVKPLFRKHVKFHTAPKIKCDKCDFESPYPWNVNRHARSHRADGNFSCLECSFVCDSNQTLQAHIGQEHCEEDFVDDDDVDNNYDDDDNDESAVLVETTSDASPVKATQSLTMRSGTVNIVQYPGHKEAVVKMLRCAYCTYTHKESKSMVSHLSIHTGKKPYKCRLCDFSSNWKEVVARHAKSRHNGSNLDVEQLFKYTVSKFVCRVLDEKGELNTGPEYQSPPLQDTNGGEVPTEEDADSTDETPASSIPETIDEKEVAGPSSGVTAASLSRYGYSGFRGQFKCDLCPFRAEKAFHIDFHLKRHTPQEGADFKCPHCPYWVNAKKSLTRHMYLHDCEKGLANPPDGSPTFEDDVGEEDDQSTNARTSQLEKALTLNTEPATCWNKRASAKNACDYCPFVAGTKTQLLYHKQFHRPNRGAAYKCQHCTYSVSHQHLLNQHVKVHFKPQPNQQPEGNHSTASLASDDIRSSLDTDPGMIDLPSYAVVGNTKFFQCKYCPMKSDKRNLMIVHLQQHEAATAPTADILKCQLCPYQSANRSSFLSHLDGHVKEENNKRAMDDDDNFRSPNKRFHNGMSRQQPQQSPGRRNGHFTYVCPSCPAAFKSPGDLKIHSVFHGSINYPHSCYYCSYKAKNRPQLSKHLYVHTQEYVAKRSASYPHATQLIVDTNEIMQRRARLEAEEREELFFGDRLAVQTPPPLRQLQVSGGQVVRNPFMLKTKARIAPTRGVSHALPDYSALDIDIDYTQIDVSQLRPSLVEKMRYHIEQLCIIERQETLDFLSRTKQKVRHHLVHKCPACPASFAKVQTLKFHSSLHGYDGQFRCPKCSYAVDFDDSLDSHKQLHSAVQLTSTTNSNLSSSFVIQPTMTPSYNHRCTKCPAAFSKPSRLEKHLALHGSGAKHQCDKCDYAVPFAATLVKHKHVHDGDILDEAVSVIDSHPMASAKHQLVPIDSLTEPIKLSDPPTKTSGGRGGHGDPNTYFCCDRCPYSHPRRDAVQSHQKRHEQERSVRDGKKCPHCDYVCLQPSYLREHIRLHFEPPNDRKARFYREYEDIELWATTDKSEEKDLLFRDTGKDKEIANRFEPHVEDKEFVDFYKTLPTLLSKSIEDDDDDCVIGEEDEEEEDGVFPDVDDNEICDDGTKEQIEEEVVNEEIVEDEEEINSELDGEHNFLEPNIQLDEEDQSDLEETVEEEVVEMDVNAEYPTF